MCRAKGGVARKVPFGLKHPVLLRTLSRERMREQWRALRPGVHLPLWACALRELPEPTFGRQVLLGGVRLVNLGTILACFKT